MTLLNSPFDGDFEHGTGFQKDLRPDVGLIVYPGDAVTLLDGASYKYTVERFDAINIAADPQNEIKPIYVIVQGNSEHEHNPTKYVAGIKKGITFTTERFNPDPLLTYNVGDFVTVKIDPTFSWSKCDAATGDVDKQRVGRVTKVWQKEGFDVIDIEIL